MAKIVVQTDHAPKSFAGYSQAVKAGGLVFVSGQGPFDPTGALVGTTIQEQTAQCFRNIETILKAAGSSLERAVSATFILGEESDFVGMNEEWNRWFKVDPPARQGAKLPIRPNGMKISVAVIAEA
jgi:2-iminobutanoate/2-iminopropanoate deaminase